MKKSVLLYFLLGLVVCVSAQNAKPFVIPELREWKAGKGSFNIFEKKSIAADNSADEVARLFADDFKEMFQKEMEIKPAQTADILFEIDKNLLKDKGEEAYQIIIDNTIKVRANHRTGLYWATRTLLQLAEQSNHLPSGEIIDYPDYHFRGFMLDAGRKFFTLDYLKSVVKLMAYYKMNTFQIHLNDNGFKQFYGEDWQKTYSAFRLQSDTYPGLAAKDGHYGKEDFRQLQLDALKVGVTIIPEIDAPAHTLAFSHYLPEIGSKEYGADHVDLFNPKTYQFLDALFKEYLSGDKPVFVNELVHIGTDEYSNKDVEVVEKFRYFTDYYIKYIESFGKKAALWGALTHAQGKTPVKVDDVLMFCWYNGYAQPKDMLALGYDIVSIPDGWLYIVPAAGYYFDYLNLKKLYNQWTPNVVGDVVFDDKHPKIKGGMFAVWNDHVGNGISQQDVYHRLFPAMQTLSVKMWSGKNTTIPFEMFDAQRKALSEAPSVNLLGKPAKAKKGVVFEIKKPVNGADLNQELTDIGYDYRVTFFVNAKSNGKDTPLFTSDYATFYLADPKEGKLGFSRDGYNYRFNYFVPTRQKVKITIKGTNKTTALYVNDQLIETLKEIYHPEDTHLEEKKRRKWVQTLVFPLKRLEYFNGKVTDLKVEFL
ncbi:family 20 glycosylhydrolase [Capnocytophaga sp.]|uniref:family 20 glycosylhydrolase n=1 Tax=Capnocytophaga sp. TaxID=44737 RepID=UPI0026DD1B14|nr:family 20 glycosylhydrolase [Capnocytophaga sp.]MDO5105405.1 family 20 glycosylhydrolase [Capnocytophaga sp.]